MSVEFDKTERRTLEILRVLTQINLPMIPKNFDEFHGGLILDEIDRIIEESNHFKSVLISKKIPTKTHQI